MIWAMSARAKRELIEQLAGAVEDHWETAQEIALRIRSAEFVTIRRYLMLMSVAGQVEKEKRLNPKTKRIAWLFRRKQNAKV